MCSQLVASNNDRSKPAFRLTPSAPRWLLAAGMAILSQIEEGLTGGQAGGTNEVHRISRAVGDSPDAGLRLCHGVAYHQGFVEDWLKMTMRRLLLFREVNGLGWAIMAGNSKTMFLMGVNSGQTVLTAWASFPSFPVCHDQIKKTKYPPITNKDMVQEVEKFYQTASNVPLPASMAVLLTYMRLNGTTPEDMGKFRAAALKDLREVEDCVPN